jgi:hypothetical protein
MTATPFAPLLIAGVIGLMAGTHASIWGMYKDAVYEGFAAGSFARSILLGVAGALVVQLVFVLPLVNPGAMVVLFGIAYAAERGLVETWKTFVRVQDQSKYFIPMQFSVRGVPVEHRGLRLAAGAGYVGLLALGFALVAWLDRSSGTLAPSARAAIVGLAVGMIIAIGGCWKDAPKEGFEPLKFFRSPVVALLCAVVLSRLSANLLHLAIASIGFERAVVETYKTFFARSKPPGKFAGKPIRHPQMLARRRWLVPAYAAISTAVVATLVIAW